MQLLYLYPEELLNMKKEKSKKEKKKRLRSVKNVLQFFFVVVIFRYCVQILASWQVSVHE